MGQVWAKSMQQNATGDAVAAPPCWICGNPADSGEHKAKKSDLKHVFATVSQSVPLFLNDASNKNRQVRSFNADAVKWERMLCCACNSTRTQPHDEAWSTMSRGLQSWTPALAPGAVVQADHIFAVDTARAMLNVHLYFVKAFGCLVVKAGASAAMIDLSTFSRAILEGRAHPDLYLAVGVPPKISRGPVVSASDPMILMDKRDGSCTLATWFYNVNRACVLVAYAPDAVGPIWARKEHLWHPRDGNGDFVVKDFTDRGESASP
jgi:hypothetical protein